MCWSRGQSLFDRGGLGRQHGCFLVPFERLLPVALGGEKRTFVQQLANQALRESLVERFRPALLGFSS